MKKSINIKGTVYQLGAGKKVTLSNDFHATEAVIILRPLPNGRDYFVSRRQARRCERILCGQADCVCGDTFGRRGGEQALNILDEVGYYAEDMGYVVYPGIEIT